MAPLPPGQLRQGLANSFAQVNQYLDEIRQYMLRLVQYVVAVYDFLLPYTLLSPSTGAAAHTGVATLVAGTVVVATTAVTANTEVLLSYKLPITAVGALFYVTNVGVGFTIFSTAPADASQVIWLLVEKA